jgi:hypothetical protein
VTSLAAQGPQADRRARRGRVLLWLGVSALWLAVYGAGVVREQAERLSAATLIGLGALVVPLPAGGRALVRLASTWFVHVDSLHLLGSELALLALAVLWPRRVRSLLVSLVGCGLAASAAALYGYAGRSVVSAGPSGALLGAAVVGAVLQRGWRRLGCVAVGAALLLGPGLRDDAAHLGGAAAGLGLVVGLRLLRARARLRQDRGGAA